MGTEPINITRVLPADFYYQDTIEVARQLLGKYLVRVMPSGKRRVGRIVETEAYLGAEDPACHTYGFRRTARTATMYLPGGHSYVYLIYGMYFCFNVVTRTEREPEAVLIRALESVEGFESMTTLGVPAHHIANGPGKLCRAMGIDRSFNGLPLLVPPLLITDGDPVTAANIIDGPRVGVDYAGDACEWPLRFAIKDHPAVSKPKLG